MRTFVHIRGMLAEHHELKLQLANLERRYDKQFKVVFDAIKEIMNDKLPPRKRQIGFGRAVALARRRTPGGPPSLKATAGERWEDWGRDASTYPDYLFFDTPEQAT